MTDRDDELRRKLGWTGPEESDFEPPNAEPEPPPPPSRRCPRGLRSTSWSRDRGLQDARGPKTSVVPNEVRGPEDWSERWSRRRPGPEDDAASRARANRGPPEPAPAPSPLLHPSGARTARRRVSPTAPARYGPPPGSPRDTGPLPAANRPDNGPWSPPPAQQPPRQQRPPAPPNQAAQHGSAVVGGSWLRPRTARAPPPPSGSYAERIRADDLVPARRVPPSRGWRHIVYRATFGLVNPGPCPTSSAKPSWRPGSSRCCAGTTRSV